MRLDSPFDALHAAVAAAVHRDLSDIYYQDRDWAVWKKTKQDVRVEKTRRPHSGEVEVVMFPQTWGSTALGYGGLGGAAMTPAYTVLVSHRMQVCVYFGPGGELAYKLDLSELTPEGQAVWEADVRMQRVASRADMGRYKV